MKQLASYPKQIGLAKTLREISRIERTLFMLDWFRAPICAIGLTLLTAAITLWNMVYTERAIESLKRKGILGY